LAPVAGQSARQAPRLQATRWLGWNSSGRVERETERERRSAGRSRVSRCCCCCGCCRRRRRRRRQRALFASFASAFCCVPTLCTYAPYLRSVLTLVAPYEPVFVVHCFARSSSWRHHASARASLWAGRGRSASDSEHRRGCEAARLRGCEACPYMVSSCFMVAPSGRRLLRETASVLPSLPLCLSLSLSLVDDARPARRSKNVHPTAIESDRENAHTVSITDTSE
jgi:hypothetical protein